MPMQCRTGCAACCIAASISSAIPGMPYGKPAGVPCIQLTDEYRCRLFNDPARPAFCQTLQPAHDMCGSSTAEAMRLIAELEQATLP